MRKIATFSGGVNSRVIMNFWVRRWFRTLPLYYAVIILKFIFLDSSLGPKVLVYFVFLQNNFVGIDFLPVSWSLVIEEWFYLTIPILMFLFLRKNITKEKFLFFLIAFILLENIIRLLWVIYSGRGYAGIVGNFPFRLDSLMIGVLLAHLKLNYNSIYKRLNSGLLFLLFFGAFFLLLFVFASVSKQGALKDELIWTRTIWFSLVSVLIALQIPFIANIKVSGKAWLGKLITLLSLYTYSIYLIHPFVFHAIIESKEITFLWFFQALLAVLLTIIFSAIIYKFYEKPMMDLRDKIKFY